MKNERSPFIEVKELLQIINNDNLIIFDASNGKESKNRFEKEHIKNAIHVDLETVLSAIEKDPKNGGRHPLPSVENFAQSLSSFGLQKNHQVVIYDDNNGGIAASRFWWMLKSFGHENVKVLNGGYSHAKGNGIPTDAEHKKTVTSNYTVSTWDLPMVDFDEVKIASEKNNSIIIDVRSPERYAGDNEPIDKVAGHIPSAINIPFGENIGENGLFKSIEEIKEMYASISDTQNEVIIHCGSGVTACHTILALNSAGFDFPKLYVGSWSEWSRRES